MDEIIRDLSEKYAKAKEEIKNLKEVNAAHQKINGDLRKELAEVIRENEDLKKQLKN